MWNKNELLGYSKYVIYQNHQMFSFTLDSMLLGSFINVRKDVKNILDLGTGNGAIPMYLTLKTKAHITGIEIQKDVYEMALKGVLENNLTEQITLINDDLHHLNKYPLREYDLICSNPPYFKLDKKSNLNESIYKQIARHEIKVNLESLLEVVSKLLKNGGYFYFVHLPERLNECFILLNKYNLEPKKIRFVYPNKNKKANHVLIEAKKTNNKGNLIVDSPLYVYKSNGKWTNEILKIYNLGCDKDVT